MKVLVDESLSARVARLLAVAGHDALHVGDIDLLGALDEAVMEAAHAEDRVLVAADTDFGELLAIGAYSKPSVVLVRRSPHAVEDQVELILRCLDAVGEELATGAIIVLTPNRLRVRSLPIVPGPE